MTADVHDAIGNVHCNSPYMKILSSITLLIGLALFVIFGPGAFPTVDVQESGFKHPSNPDQVNPIESNHLQDFYVSVIASGGYMSCGFGRSPETMMFRSEVEKIVKAVAAQGQINSENIRKLYSCFRVDGLETTTNLFSSSASDHVDPLRAAVATAIHPTKPSYVIAIGHSWGATLVMEMVKAIDAELAVLGKREQSHVQLVTMDPIDFDACRPPLANVIGNQECQNFPRRLRSRAAQIQMADSVESWLNIYQREDPFIASNRIPILDEPEQGAGKINVSLGDFIAIGAHARMTKSESVWQLIREQTIPVPRSSVID